MKARLASDAIALSAVVINYVISSEPLAGLTLLLVALVLSLNIAFIGGAFLGLWALAAAAAARYVAGFVTGPPIAVMTLYLVLLSVLHRFVELPEDAENRVVLVLSALGAGGAAALITNPALVAWVVMGPIVDNAVEELINDAYHLGGRAATASAIIARASVALAAGVHPVLAAAAAATPPARAAIGRGYLFIILDTAVRAVGTYLLGVQTP